MDEQTSPFLAGNAPMGTRKHTMDRADERRLPWRLAFECLEPRTLLAANVLISEFLTVNANATQDEDHDHPGWIELYNAGDSAQNLTGWHLSDNAADLGKWTFPTGLNIDPGKFLLVYASGKNRTADPAHLHTNFTLSAGGGYLALANGAPVVQHAFAAYPAQLTDTSYGLAFPPPAASPTVILNPTVDVWLRQSQSNTLYETDAMWVSAPGVFPELRYGAAEWDLSGVPQIVGAHMEFAKRTRADAGAQQIAFRIDGGIQGMTWGSYQATRAASETAFSTLGRYTGTGAEAAGIYASGENASAADVAMLNSLRMTGGHVAAVFKATSGAFEWHDGSNPAGPAYAADLPVRLILETQQVAGADVIDPASRRFFASYTPAARNVGGSLVLAESVFISEFLAENDSGLTDEDGAASDWIEIYNGTPTTLQLSGWHLTDDAAIPAKWTFPTGLAIDSGTFLLVFASGKNRATLGGQLHTNFKLDADGEYLALVDNSLNVRHSYANFPRQFANTSYGLTFDPAPPTPSHQPPAGGLYRVDFDDAAALIPATGNEPLAAAASARFDSSTGQWSDPAVPHHIGGSGGGITGFSRTLLDSYGGKPITWSHVAGNPLRANTATSGGNLHRDFWFLTTGTFVDWMITGLTPGADYEMFHYGGWPQTTPDDERIVIRLDTDANGSLETSKTAGLPSGGIHGVHFPLVKADASGRIVGRWEGVAGTTWADTAGFQLALVSGVPLAGGSSQALDPDARRYFDSATPGTRNPAQGTLGFSTADTIFSHDRGFYQSAFDLMITSNHAAAVIYYTLDGSDPSTTAQRFNPQTPIHISRTTTVRAVAIESDFPARNIDTHTYLFLDDVITQSPTGQAPAGWPTGPVAGQVLNYGVDPQIVSDPVWGPQLKAALEAVPSISLVTDLDNLFDPATGLYVNAVGTGMQWERPTSMELIYPDGTSGFQIDAGLRPRGNFSASDANPKHSFRLFFRSQYGDAKLRYPMFGDEGVSEFEKLDLITPQNDSWAWQNSSQMTFVHDVFARDLQGNMGQPYTRSRYYHLYINGQYWGLYQTEERPEASYAASYFGGVADDYDVIKSTGGPAYAIEATDGNLAAWQTLWDGVHAGVEDNATYLRLQGRNPDGTLNPVYPVLLDVDNLVDYMIGIFYTGDEDRGLSLPLGNNRPNNFYAIRDRNGQEGFKFFAHDAEQSLLSKYNVGGLNANRVGPFLGSNQNNLLYSNPQWIHQELTNNAEYRSRFADRVHKYFFNQGLLTPAVVSQEFLARAAEIDQAIVGESARWGDAQREPPFTKNHWQAAIDALVNTYFPARSAIVLDQLKQAKRPSAIGLVPGALYPSLAAPVFNQHGGNVDPGFNLAMSMPGAPPATGTIYYTLDGSDPRLAGGGPSPTALTYVSATAIQQDTVVKARTLDGSNWSALNEATFFVQVPAAAGNLAVTEINYNPVGPSSDELSIDPAFTGGDFEFVELKNVGLDTIDLAGVQIAFGITFEFPAGRLLHPGELIVVAKNLSAIQTRYGTGINVVGPFGGNLSNGGEQLNLLDHSDLTIQSFTFRDEPPWPSRADGLGATLEVVDTSADYNSSDNWNSSDEYGGSPGTVGTGPIDDVVINEVLSHSDLPLVDTIELYNRTSAPINVGGWYLSDSSGNLKKYRIPTGTVLPTAGYLTFDESQFNPTPAAPGPDDFSLNGAHGDDVWLTAADGTGKLERFVDDVSFPAAGSGESLGRWPSGMGDFYPMTSRTFGAANSGPQIGPIAISELMYNPGASLSDDDLEYIELANITSAAIDISGWKFDAGVEFTFPAGTTISAHGTLAVARFNPTDALAAPALSAFQSAYGASAVILGGYLGRLDDEGETVRLVRPAPTPPEEPLFTPYLLVDEVSYDDIAPWPTGASGTGKSLTRITSALYGREPASWRASPPSLGSLGFTHVVDRHLFYNDSIFDGQNIAANTADDGAIATDKVALRPGGTATFANYSSYSQGLNGVMIDLENFVGMPSATDFDFRIGNNNNPGSWSDGPFPQSVSVRALPGLGNLSRVSIAWADGAIRNQWLQITAKTSLGLAVDDVFYFGIAVAESGDSPTKAVVNATDEINARNNPRTFLAPALIDSPYDFNRDGFVNAADQILARSNASVFGDELQLIEIPTALSAVRLTPNAVDTALATPAPEPFEANGLDSSTQILVQRIAQNQWNPRQSVTRLALFDYDDEQSRQLGPPRRSPDESDDTTQQSNENDELLELLSKSVVCTAL